MSRYNIFTLVIGCLASITVSAQTTSKIVEKDKQVVITSKATPYKFTGQFTVFFSKTDPKMVARPAGIKSVNYNVLTWQAVGKADLAQTKVNKAEAGDGFDDKILAGDKANRTPNFFNASAVYGLSPVSATSKKNVLTFNYADQKLFDFSASITLNDTNYPVIKFTLRPKVSGYYSVCYSGAPAFAANKLNEIWQPLIWQEKRFPDKPYLTPSYLNPIPTTFVNDGKNTIGVLADPKYLPFDPLPVLTNSQFGVSVRDSLGRAQTQIIAPILGGYQSKMAAGTAFNFSAALVVEPMSVNLAYEKIARTVFGFKDYRHNDIATLNQTLDNIVSYSLTKYALFVDSLKGCAYSTDVPGAVKNVSSLHPLELAILMNDKAMFEKRAYPLMEYLLSREKFLFSLDSNQVIQSPSRKLKGPVAPVSELVSLYDIFNKQNPLFLTMAQTESGKSRKRNLDDEGRGDTWQNIMYLYKATGDKSLLAKATREADAYLKNLDESKDKFTGSKFFWTTFTNDFIGLYQLYEITGNKKYLDAAHEGARYYTMFTWMTPKIPDSLVTVNKGGKAPVYWYLQGKGHKPMFYPEEKVPAWRLSEMGLTSESSGTSAGHRAIFMANYAPWMLKIGYYTHDAFLQQVAKAAIIGRYRSFPGYHINTARTDAYEKLDFPLHNFMDLSVNSFHYNHILPMASMLVDYLVSDAFVRSDGKINFPAEYAEGYAYLQNDLYGSKPGNFYNDKDVQLWMPAHLLKTSNIELNYITGRKGHDLYIALMNQSDKPVNSTISLNDSLVQLTNAAYYTRVGNQWLNKTTIKGKSIHVNVKANGLTVVKIQGANMQSQFQDSLLDNHIAMVNDLIDVDFGHAKAMLFKLGDYSTRAYVYLQDDDNIFSSVNLSYVDAGGKKQVISKKSYPFEFTVNLPPAQKHFEFTLQGTKKNGTLVKSSNIKLGK